ncbi:alpha/beta hydrolase [Novosphingobium sp. PC22D]|uniref:alpha/beta hydrolase n=1 Tax=Novosphingobium sp. PC22D TaxID=1962403 RepID=UPI00320471B3
MTYEIVETYEVLPGGGERFLGAETLTLPEDPIPAGIAAFGPFRVLDARRAALVGVTDAASPRQFSAMLRAFPGISEIEMIDCPGTEDDLANLRVGRMIRSAGIAMRVPANGSVRSGAVELFLAGTRRIAEPGAEFAVHAWLDDTGHEATDYSGTDPENAKYLTYYREMGMSGIEAEAFYAMTNAAPHRSARWLNAAQMAMWVRLDGPAG